MKSLTTRRGFLSIVGGAAVAAAGAAHGHLTAVAVTPDQSGAFLLCDGQMVSRREFPDLFKVLGPSYGEDGDLFALPDCRPRNEVVPVGSSYGSMKAVYKNGLGSEISCHSSIQIKHAMKVRNDDSALPVGTIILTLDAEQEAASG